MARPLHFKPGSVEPILQRSERLTVRRPGSGYRPGERVKAVVRRRPAFAELKILKVETLGLGELTRSHLRRSGLTDLAALRDSVRRIYPKEDRFDVISFELG